MNKRTKTAAMLLVGTLFLGSFAMMIWKGFQYRQGDSAYAQAEELAGVAELQPDTETAIAEPVVPLAETPAPVEQPEEPEETPWEMDEFATALAETDFEALREVNEDVIGWIAIPDTVISYPLMQADDNQKYLHTSWDGAKNDVGSIFLECRNDPALTDFNTIIYGHRMNNGSMFGSLKSFAEQDCVDEHPLIYIADDTGCKAYAIFAVYEASVKGYAYALDLDEETDREAFLDYAMGRSFIDTGIWPDTDDRILTLSTCTGWGYDTRWVVQAVLL